MWGRQELDEGSAAGRKTHRVEGARLEVETPAKIIKM